MPCGNLLMRGKQILVLFLGISTLACTGAPPSATPLPPPSDPPDPGFCNKAGTNLLTTVDGSWSLQQGAGWALAGPIPIPLPPHEAAPIIFKFDPQQGLTYAQSADLAEEMVMFPAFNEQQDLAEELLKTQDIDTSKISGSGCDWDKLPIVIGTNHYSSFSVSTMCYAIAQAQKRYGFPLRMDNCEKLPPQVFPSELDMEMTLVVRFISSRYGLGTLFFQGTDKSTVTVGGESPFSYLYKRESFEMESKYMAQVPVTLFR